jgi:1-acyl-sn-glycerol-3-phosphate acyltransferase
MTEPIRKPSRAAPAKNGKPRARSRTTNGVPPDVRLNGRRRTGPAPNELALAPAQADEIRNGRTNGRATKAAKPKPAAAPAARPKPAAAPAAKPKPKPARPTPAKSPPDVWDERVAGALRFVRRRLTGEYEVDEFGFDPEFTETFIHPMLRVFKERYFRIETTGVEHLPRDSAALIVANHSGTLPMDALMLGITVHDESPNHRHLRLLGADLVFRIPILSELARKSGSTLACNPDVERLLRSDELVGVFPEGFKGIGKPYRDRYKLQRFGRGGFVSAALRTGTPIIPASIVGAEEIYPIIANVRPLAKMTGLPYVPVTPLFPWLGPLGLLPLPSKWLIEFGEPIKTAELSADADDPIVVFNLADQVRETIQQTLHEMLKRRPDAFA